MESEEEVKSEKPTYWKRLRGSDAPLAMLCAGAVHPGVDEVLIDSVNPAGSIGTVVHGIAEEIVETGRVPANWQNACEIYGFSAEQTKEVGFLVYAARDCWNLYQSAFVQPKVEAALQFELHPEADRTVFLSCHTDVYDVQDAFGIILDWKTTRADIDYTAQMLFYAWVLMLLNPDVLRVTTIQAFLRDRTASVALWTRDQVEEFGKRYEREVIQWDGRTYRPGGHCAHCRRFSLCPAHTALVKQTIAELEVAPSDASVVEFYQRVQAVNTLVEKAKAHVKAAVEQAGGEIDGGNGTRLVLAPSGRDSIDARLAWPIIEPELSPDELTEATEIKKGVLLDFIAAHAPRGQKAKAKQEIMQRLTDAGAVTRTEFSTLRVKQSNERLKEIPDE